MDDKTAESNQATDKTKYGRIPDFRFSRIAGRLFGPAEYYESCNMYIDERVKIDDKRERIKGTIDDKAGIAIVEGEMSDEDLKFTMKYTPEAIANGAPEGILLHKGFKTRSKTSYAGCFQWVVDGKVEGEYTTKFRFGIRQYVHPILGDADTIIKRLNDLQN